MEGKYRRDNTCSRMTSPLTLVRRPLGCMALAVENSFAFVYDPSMEAFTISAKVIPRTCFLPYQYQMLNVFQPMLCFTPGHLKDSSCLSSVLLLLVSPSTRAGSFLAIFISELESFPISSVSLLLTCALIY